jgi:hypothetical protein
MSHFGEFLRKAVVPAFFIVHFGFVSEIWKDLSGLAIVAVRLLQ